MFLFFNSIAFFVKKTKTYNIKGFVKRKMRGNFLKVVLIIAVLLASVVAFFRLQKKIKTFTATQNEVVQLTFELDKKFEFGEYYFDLNNGKSATYPLCFCLTEKNMFPPDCFGDVKYIYNNTPGTMCVPLSIGTGRCSTKIMSSSSFATPFLIPLEYQWTKPIEKIIMGIKVPAQAPEGAKLVVEVTIFKRDDRGKSVLYRKYEQSIIVKSAENG